MLVPLSAATASSCGNKAATLGTLLRAGLPVPDGVVIPFTSGLAALEEVERWLESVGDRPVAVRSSAANEDTASRSAAGQYDSFLGVQGVDAVVQAVRACWASLWSPRAAAYRATSDVQPSMAVIIQRHLDAEVSGVMFSPVDAGDTLIEASWGLGPSVVEGRVTPDRYRVSADGAVTSTIADKPTSVDRLGSSVVVRQLPMDQRTRATLTDATAVQLAELGRSAAAVVGGPQDIEWAITADTPCSPWLLQSRPITAHPPTSADVQPAPLRGTPGSHGTATGPARIVHGPADFPHVRPGDILVCRYTDPAWTPLLAIAAGVVTETGGILSHAAIVAREHAIPAVVGVPHATTRIPNTTPVTINGTTGTIHLGRRIRTIHRRP